MTERPRSLRYLALGDSYTIGEGVSASQRWPAVLASKLRERGVPISDPEIIARTGWTTDELNGAIDSAAPQGPYDLVTLLIGVNNQYRGRDAEQYRRELAALLQRAVAFAGGRASRVVMLSIPDWGITPYAQGRDRQAISAAIVRYNEVGGEEARRAGVGWVDISPISREAATDLSLIVSDQLHPSGVMYQRWVEAALPEVIRAVSSK